MWDLVEQYDQLKRRAGKLDFVDLLLLARDLVRDKPEVRRYLQDRFTHIFIDEFQDTDPLQAEILLLLAADDPAQSDWLQRHAEAGKAVRRRRSQAIHLQVPARRRGALSRDSRRACSSAASAWCS